MLLLLLFFPCKCLFVISVLFVVIVIVIVKNDHSYRLYSLNIFLLSLFWALFLSSLSLSLSFIIISVSGFYGSTLSTAVFPQRFTFFTVCLVNYLCEVLQWLAPKEKFLKFRSPDCCKMQFWHFFWLQKHNLYIICLQRLQFFLKFESFMGSFMRMSFITQFKIDFLLSFTGFRKVLGKNDWVLLLLLLSPLLLSLLFLIMFVVKHDLGENQFLCYFEQHCLPLLIRSDLFFFLLKLTTIYILTKRTIKHIYIYIISSSNVLQLNSARCRKTEQYI